ncbi:hypothetical protein AtubIFM57258_009346 [Aspergillus tubingensis]|nr:hypothetical protein AtubIFM57258_009346 [Aspergillus tubingensis]
MTYESVRKYLTPEGDATPGPLRKLLAGAVSGAVAQTCTYPLAIVAQEGLRGLFKGIVPNLLKVAPSMASSWLSFELTRDFLVGLEK